MSRKIIAIELGNGEDSTYYKISTGGVTNITQYLKPIEYVNDAIHKEMIVYGVFVGEKQICEIESNANITLHF